MPDSIYTRQTVNEPGGENVPGSNYADDSRLTPGRANQGFVKRRRAIEKSVDKLLSNPGSIANKFNGLVERLVPEFKLIRAGLLFKSLDSNKLASAAIWNDGALLSDVSVGIPAQDSILMELLETDCAKVISPAACFLGNFVETRLFVSDPFGSLAIFPLCLEENRLGLVILNSTVAESFHHSARWISSLMDKLTGYVAHEINCDALHSA